MSFPLRPFDPSTINHSFLFYSFSTVISTRPTCLIMQYRDARTTLSNLLWPMIWNLQDTVKYTLTLLASSPNWPLVWPRQPCGSFFPLLSFFVFFSPSPFPFFPFNLFLVSLFLSSCVSVVGWWTDWILFLTLFAFFFSPFWKEKEHGWDCFYLPGLTLSHLTWTEWYIEKVVRIGQDWRLVVRYGLTGLDWDGYNTCWESFLCWWLG